MNKQVQQAAERYMEHLRVCYAMRHPKESPYTYIDVSTGAAVMVMEAWDNDAHLLAREILGLNKGSHPSACEQMT